MVLIGNNLTGVNPCFMLRILDLGNFFVTTKEGVGPADDFQHELTQAKVGCAGTCLSEKLTGAEWPAN